MWSDKTIEHISAHTATEPTKPNMEHVWNWVSDEGTKACLKDITKPGARLMWTGTFTKNWTTNLTKMGINEATALKLARKIRKQIMYNTTAIWHTRCNVTHDNRERDEVLQKMREVANNAQTLGVFADANKSVQRACERHKKLADKKKWISTTDKRNTEARRDKANKQKHKFIKHFAIKDNKKTSTAGEAAPRTTETYIPAETESHKENEEEEVHRARHASQTTVERTAEALDSTDSDEETPPEGESVVREPQNTSITAASQASPDSEEEYGHARMSQTRKRQKTENAPSLQWNPAKTFQIPNGHCEGPIDFSDQSFLT
jgi:hypothetical protein